MLFLTIRQLAISGMAACALLNCTSHTQSEQAQRIQLAYHIKDGEKVIELKGNKTWLPQWQDSLISQLESGVLPAADQDNRPIPIDSIQRGRRLRGVTIIAGKGGSLLNGTLLHPPREVFAYLRNQSGTPVIDLYFYDRAVELELFYARLHSTDLEKLSGHAIEFVAAK